MLSFTCAIYTLTMCVVEIKITEWRVTNIGHRTSCSSHYKTKSWNRCCINQSTQSAPATAHRDNCRWGKYTALSGIFLQDIWRLQSDVLCSHRSLSSTEMHSSFLVVTSTLRIERLALFNFEKYEGHAVETRQIKKLKSCNVHTLYTCARTHARTHRCELSMFIISVPSHLMMFLCTPIPIAVTRDRGGGRGWDGDRVIFYIIFIW